jgi:hypothetical protein
MDPIVLMILTVAVNTLFTGLIVSYFVRRLESKLGREDFKYQTKFTDIYSKRMKTLEQLIQKFVTFETALVSFSSGVQIQILSKGQYSDPHQESKIQIMKRKFEDFEEFYKNNRHFLSDTVDERISEIPNNLASIRVVVSMVSDEPLLKSVPIHVMEYLPESIELVGFAGANMTEPAVLLGRLVIEVQNYSEELGKLYKLEAKL